MLRCTEGLVLYPPEVRSQIGLYQLYRHTYHGYLKHTWIPSLLCPYSFPHYHRHSRKTDFTDGLIIFFARLNSRDYLREKLEHNAPPSTTLRWEEGPRFAIPSQQKLSVRFPLPSFKLCLCCLKFICFISPFTFFSFSFSFFYFFFSIFFFLFFFFWKDDYGIIEQQLVMKLRI